MGDLTGKVAIISGASRGIGKGEAIAFGQAGASVVVAARDLNKLRETCVAVETAGGRAMAVECDVRNPEDIKECVAKTIQRFGRLDILLNNAQIHVPLFINDISEELYEDVMHSGPFAVFRFMKAAYPHLRESKGLIINTSSISLYMPDPSRQGVYNAAKGAINTTSRVALHEWSADGIRCIVIMPAAETDMSAQGIRRDPEGYAKRVANMPNRRYGDPLEDIGRPLVKLALDADRYNGKIIALDSRGPREMVETLTEHPLQLP
jgi:NAD(P)-dependent dehydrogenase (short-subunit alcohol dehydrogenase family)